MSLDFTNAGLSKRDPTIYPLDPTSPANQSIDKIEAAMSAAIDVIRAEMATWTTPEQRRECLPALMDSIHIHEARLMSYRHSATRQIAIAFSPAVLDELFADESEGD